MSDRFPDDLFQMAFDRASSDQDRKRLMKIKALLGLSNDDEYWPFLLMQDKYAQANEAARRAIIKEIEGLIAHLQDIPEKAGPIADAEARKSIEKIIDHASTKIAQASAKKSASTADRISKRQLVVSAIFGMILIFSAIAIGASGMFFLIAREGICRDYPNIIIQKDRDGVERSHFGCINVYHF